MHRGFYAGQILPMTGLTVYGKRSNYPVCGATVQKLTNLRGGARLCPFWRLLHHQRFIRFFRSNPVCMVKSLCSFRSSLDFLSTLWPFVVWSVAILTFRLPSDLLSNLCNTIKYFQGFIDLIKGIYNWLRNDTTHESVTDEWVESVSGIFHRS